MNNNVNFPELDEPSINYYAREKKNVHKNLLATLDCSQPSIFSYMYFYSIVERVDIIARELDTSAKRKI